MNFQDSSFTPSGWNLPTGVHKTLGRYSSPQGSESQWGMKVTRPMWLLHVTDLKKKNLHSENKKGVARSFSDFGGPLRAAPDTFLSMFAQCERQEVVPPSC